MQCSLGHAAHFGHPSYSEQGKPLAGLESHRAVGRRGGAIRRGSGKDCSGCSVEAGLERSSRWRATSWTAWLPVIVGGMEKSGWVYEKNTKCQKAHKK